MCAWRAPVVTSNSESPRAYVGNITDVCVLVRVVFHVQCAGLDSTGKRVATNTRFIRVSGGGGNRGGVVVGGRLGVGEGWWGGVFSHHTPRTAVQFLGTNHL